MTRPTTWKLAVALVAFSTIGVAVAQTATSPQSEPKRKVQQTEASSPGGAAQQVAADPASGEPGAPTAEQIGAIERAVAAMLSQSSEGLEVVELPDGTLTMDLEGRFQEVIVATIAPDGTVRVGCVNRPGQVQAALAPKARGSAKKPAAAATPLEVE